MKKSDIIEEIGRLALQSLLFEVSVTPKPGLVDRKNSGSHKDMDFFTFMTSASALGTFSFGFLEFARKGYELAEKNTEPKNILKKIRPIGIKAEKKMFQATKGINTHKGEIFSLGLLSTCAGYLIFKNEFLIADEILNLAGEVCSGICEKDFASIKTKSPDELTKGEKVFLKYGISGVRGEAENSYPCVKKALPVFKSLLKSFNLNDALSITLLKIISENYDTNIISRHDFETMRYAQKIASEKFELIVKGENHKFILEALDKDFISKNISPSGSADLLAVTHFIYSLDNMNDNS